MRILLLRHGETDWNTEGRLQGREDMPLNENGILQAKLCGAALAGIPINKAITSPLKRAKRTCEIVAGYMGLDRVEIEEGLLERDFGVMSGKKLENIFAAINCEGSESLDDAAERIIAALKRHEGRPGETILALSHGAVINTLLFALTDGKAGTGVTRLKNTCVNILEAEKGELRLIAWNLTAPEAAAYLKGEAPLPEIDQRRR